tara:strand:- start:31919 stop:33010 length:1092 start_codon:yes stop_codon:yes gene_type:complete
MIDSVYKTVLAVLNKNNYGYLPPQDFNLYAKQAQLEFFEGYFYDYNNQINLENARKSGTDYADISKGLVEVIDLFSSTVTLAQISNNTYTLPSDYYLINKVLYLHKKSQLLNNNEFKSGDFWSLSDSSVVIDNTTNTLDFTSAPLDAYANTTYRVFENGKSYVAIIDIESLSLGKIALVANDDAATYSDEYTTAGVYTHNLAVTSTDTGAFEIFSKDGAATTAVINSVEVYEVEAIDVERISQGKISALNISPLTAPSAEFPAYTTEGATMTMHPFTINGAVDITCQYIKYPAVPKWTYASTLIGQAPIFNPSASDYQDFELPADNENDLVNKILQYAGVEIREDAVYRFGKTEEQENNIEQQ